MYLYFVFCMQCRLALTSKCEVFPGDTREVRLGTVPCTDATAADGGVGQGVFAVERQRGVALNKNLLT